MQTSISEEANLVKAAQIIGEAPYLLFTVGAGMGVDSGLPDFRGNEGFWKAYPPFKSLGLNFRDLANPSWFEREPQLAWGFYGHRLHLYRNTSPHAGFSILRAWADQKPHWVYTSNVDGQFQKAGFTNICEVHGSIHHLQCTLPCSEAIWSAEGTEIAVDASTFRATGELPHCPNCGALARPNILMFGDGRWNEERSGKQEFALVQWLNSIELTRLAIIEMGAGRAVPTVRSFGESLQSQGAKLIRVNLRESQGPADTVSLPLGACAALERLHDYV